MANKRSYIKRINGYMREMGTFRPEYKIVINVLACMLEQYDRFEEDFISSGFQLTEPYTNKAGATNDRKTPTYLAMESLRKDIAAYSDRLYLNPKALGDTATKQTSSKLSDAMESLSKKLNG